MFSTVALLLFQVTSGWGFVFNFVFLALAGASNCAPDAVLTGSIPAQLSEMSGRNAAASVSGFVNGMQVSFVLSLIYFNICSESRSHSIIG